MKKNLKFFILSAMMTLSFSVPHPIYSIEDFSKSERQLNPAAFGVIHSARPTNSSFDDFLNSNPPLYHQVSMVRYRDSVHALRQEIKELQNRIVTFSNISNDYAVLEKKIARYEEMLELQKQALNKYGSDPDIAKQKITQYISELEEAQKNYEQAMQDEPSLKGFYTAQIENAGHSLENCKKYLSSLSKSEVTLQAEVETARQYLRTFNQQASSSGGLKEFMAQKIRDLKHLYESHAKGLCNSEIFTPNLPKEVLESLGITPAKVNNINSERLFQLFARSMELPYFPIQTGEEIDKVYIKHLKKLSQNFNSRLLEDVFAFKVGLSLAQSGQIPINFRDKGKHLKNFVEDRNVAENIRAKDAKEAQLLKNILSTYGFKESADTSKFLSDIVNQSSCGLLGLCIGSLEDYPVISWNESSKMASHVCMETSRSKEEISMVIANVIYNILGRHINKIVLDKISSSFENNIGRLLPNKTSDDFYI